MKNTLSILFLFCAVSLHASENRDNALKSGIECPGEQPIYSMQPTAQITLGILTAYQSSSPVTQNSRVALSNKAATNRKAGKGTPFRRFLKEHKLQLTFSGICLGSALATVIFNSAAKNQLQREEKLHNTYMKAGPGSDFDKLWRDVEDARDKTDAYLNVRNGFGMTTGAIGIALFFSFSLEKG